MQGTGINIDRGGIELIEAISKTENVSLLIVGGGDMITVLKEKVIRYNLAERVKFFPKVPWEELIRYTKAADVGLSLDKDTNINYRFSLPNKLFDYITAGIPVIASNLPEVSKIVTENNCGIIIPDVSPAEIMKAIQKLKENQDLLAEFKKNAVIASESLSWENESIKAKSFYSSILGLS
jgi:glycosyltransferase involved in cell wall biosynthesis